MTALLIGALCICLTACSFWSIWLGVQIKRIDINTGIMLDMLRGKHGQ